MLTKAVRTLALSALSGGLLSLAFPGSGEQGWLVFVALVPLLVAIEGATWRRAGGLGFVAGLVFWLATIPWVAATMIRYGGLPWPLASLLLLALAGYLALYWSAFCVLLSRCPPRSGALYVVVAASLWVALEFLRSYLLTGFPWNLLGYSQYRHLPLIQVAAVTGVYGVSFIVLAVNAALACALLARTHWRGLLAPLGTAGLLATGAVAYGWLWRLPEAGSPAMRVALAQGNIKQGVKWDPAWQDKTLDIYRELTREAARQCPELVVWPEAAVPFLLREDPRREEVEALARWRGRCSSGSGC